MTADVLRELLVSIGRLHRAAQAHHKAGELQKLASVLGGISAATSTAKKLVAADPASEQRRKYEQALRLLGNPNAEEIEILREEIARDERKAAEREARLAAAVEAAGVIR